MSRKMALLIGVNKYGEGIPPLSAPSNDVAAMERVMKNPEMGGFEVEALLDPDPIQMQKAIKKLFSNCGKEDLVLLFFSGHGITDDENKLYLATSITSKNDFDATAVPASFVQQQSKYSYTKRQVIVLDCCYSGAFAEGWQAKSIGINLRKELGAEGRVVLTSSTATQTSFQQEGEELSLYTQYLLEGIETGAADRDEDGKIHAHELHQYAKAKVKEVKPKQEPGIIIDREGFNILLSQTPVSDPELEYRKLVEKYASKGEISSYRRETLKLKQKEFLLTDEKADQIINSVLDPFRRRLVNLEQYRKNYRQQIEKQYPLNRTLAQDIKDWGEQVLGLKDEDLAKIEQEVHAEKETEQERYNNKLQQYKQEFLKAVKREYPLTKKTRARINIWQQSLGLKDQDIRQIEQPILAAKYQETVSSLDNEQPNVEAVPQTKLRTKQLPINVKQPSSEVARNKEQVSSVLPASSLAPAPDSKSSPAPILPSLNKSRLLMGSWIASVLVSIFTGYTYINHKQPDLPAQKALEQIETLKAAEKYQECVQQGEKFPQDYSDLHPEAKTLLDECRQKLQAEEPSKSKDEDATAENNQQIELKSDQGIDYTPLRNYLEAGSWQEADLETHKFMLKTTKKSYLTPESIKNFPCNDLKTINSLWQYYSDGRFGFSIQNKEYQNLAKSINSLGDKLGWRQQYWMRYDYLWEKFHPNVPAG
ncbi:MAG: GUN4 domain-containing protein, partial [Cyanobacteria bacterium P01_A01_bin.40]